MENQSILSSQRKLIIEHAPSDRGTPTLICRETSGSADIYVTRLTGKLSLETVHEFLCMMRPEPASYLVLDMSGVSFLDSAGVGALVRCSSAVATPGKGWRWRGLHSKALRHRRSGLTHLLPVYDSVDLAIRQIRM